MDSFGGSSGSLSFCVNHIFRPGRAGLKYVYYGRGIITHNRAGVYY